MGKYDIIRIGWILFWLWMLVFMIMLVFAAQGQSDFHQRPMLGKLYVWIPLWKYLWCPLALAMICLPKGRDC